MPDDRLITTGTVTVAVPEDNTTMPMYVARPVNPNPPVGLMVFQEVFGVNHHIRDVTERFARQGYIAVAPALFHRTDPSFEAGYGDFTVVRPHAEALTQEGTSADIRAAYNWLTAGEGNDVTAVGCVGYCLGGRTSFLASTLVPVKAAVSYYGGKFALDRIDKTGCPLLMFWGGQDKHIPPQQIRELEDALIGASKPYVDVVFSEAEHGFFCNERPAYNPEAARQAWPLTLEFLATHVTV